MGLPMIRNVLVLLLAAFAFAFAGCAAETEDSNESDEPEAAAEEPTEESSDDLPGNPAVYDRIAALTDCAQLQAEFDQADENHAREIASGDVEMAEVATSYM